MLRDGVISDELWDVLGSVMPQDAGRRGRPWNDHRTTMEGIIWRFRTGSPWRDLPEAFGPYQSVWQRHRLWATDGTYERMVAVVRKQAKLDGDEVEAILSIDSTIVRAHQHAAGARRDLVIRTLRATQGAGSNYTNSRVVPGEPADHALGRSRGGLSTKVHALSDLTCTPVIALLTAGQAGDNPMLATLVAALGEIGEDLDFRLLADKAYSHPSTRTFLRGKKIKHTIPEKSDQIARRKAKGSKGGRPPGFDRETYQKRNTIERSFSRVKQWRGLATRYDKYAVTCLGGVLLGMVILTHREAGLIGPFHHGQHAYSYDGTDYLSTSQFFTLLLSERTVRPAGIAGEVITDTRWWSPDELTAAPLSNPDIPEIVAMAIATATAHCR